MLNKRVAVLSAFALLMTIQSSRASESCTARLDELQANVDARLSATAAAGPFAREGTAAKLGHQPTPESIGQAEQRLHEGSGPAEMLLLLRRARDLDRAGDQAACDDAASALGRALNVTLPVWRFGSIPVAQPSEAFARMMSVHFHTKPHALEIGIARSTRFDYRHGP